MAQKHFNKSFIKTVRKSSNFLHSVWRTSLKFDIETNVYHDYYKEGQYNYVNDFTNNCWKKTSELSPEQVVCIHEDNKVKACKSDNSEYLSNKNDETHCRDKKHFDCVVTSDTSIPKHSSNMEKIDELLDRLKIPTGMFK